MAVARASCLNDDMTKLGKTFRISMALAALTLAGCSAPETVAVSPAAVSTSVPASIKPAVETKSISEQIDDVYVSMLQEDNPGLAVAEPEDMIAIGKAFCTMYDGGATSSDINNYILTAAGPGYTLKELISMHGGAVGAYCQEHLDKLGE
jgi:hypothetical protein